MFIAVFAEEDVMRVGRRCFISNLAWRTSWQDIKDKFRDCGTVVYANVIRDESGKCGAHLLRSMVLWVFTILSKCVLFDLHSSRLHPSRLQAVPRVGVL